MPINSEILSKLKTNNIFLETGSYLGDGIQKAIECGYEKIISIECKKEYHELCKEKFINNSNVELILGDSSKVLSSVVSSINEPITFWLDAHYMWNDPNQDINEHPGRGKIPLIEELEQIKNHPIKSHTLLIDDLEPLADLSNKGDDPPTGSVETQVDNLKNFVSTINNNYRFEVITLPGLGMFLACEV